MSPVDFLKHELFICLSLARVVTALHNILYFLDQTPRLLFISVG